MKVYVLVTYYFGEAKIEGVFSNYDSAKKYFESIKYTNLRFRIDEYNIDFGVPEVELTESVVLVGNKKVWEKKE